MSQFWSSFLSICREGGREGGTREGGRGGREMRSDFHLKSTIANHPRQTLFFPDLKHSPQIH